MRVIHGIWAYSALWLWAEDSDLPARAPARPGRPSQAPRPHPFACDAASLADALGELADPLADLARKAVDDELTLRLPSAADGPLDSPELIRPLPPELPGAIGGPEGAGRLGGTGARGGTGGHDPGPGQAGRRRRVLAAWRIPALTFEPSAALELLTMLAGPGPSAGQAVPDGAVTGGAVTRGSGPPGLSGSVLYLAALARLAQDMVRRGRVLPALVTEGDSFAARWHPVLSGADAQRARELAAAMPAVCRATEAAGEPPARVLASALDELADASARFRLAGTALVPRRGRSPARIPVAQRWLTALTAADGHVELATPQDETEAAALAAELAAWRNAAQAPAGPVRTCFRLIEPEPDAAELDTGQDASQAEPDAGPRADAELDTGPDADRAADQSRWLVEFSLQSTDDPSLVLPAAQIWSGTSGWAVGGIRHPEEELLAGLGTASRLFPELDTELRTAAPATAVLDTAGAFRFLQQTAPMLSGAGFGVLLPDWARKARLGLRLTTRSRSPAAAAGAGASEPKFGLQDLVDFRYDLAIGDETLDPDDLEELARLKIPLVRIRGQWVELDDRHLQAALKFLERRRTGTMAAGDALLAGLRGEDDLPIAAIDADGWLGDLLSGQADRRLAPVPTPGSFTGSLRPYQERGLAWMAFLTSIGLGGILADSMGLGKTIQLLALLAHEREPSAGAVSKNPTLLVCPMSLVGNWEQEAAKFTPQLAVHVHHGAGQADRAAARRRAGGGRPGDHHLRHRHQGPGGAGQGPLGQGGLR